jgi:hypothetical protein
MRIIRALLICFVATIVVMGCSKKMAAPEASPAPAQAQDAVQTDTATAAAKVEEVKLSLTGVT